MQSCASIKPPNVVGPGAFCLFGHDWGKTCFYCDFDKTRLQNLTSSASKRMVIKYFG